MSENRTVSINLPGDVLARAERLAGEKNLSVDELFQAALAQYDRELWWDKMNEYGRERASALGISSDDDIVEAIHELRAVLKSQGASAATDDCRR